MSGGKGAVRPRSGQRNSFAFRLADWLTAAAACVLAAALLLFVIYTPVSVTSSGVSDFYNGDLVFADRLSRYIFNISRGDAAVIKPAGGAESERRIARIIAFGGENVTVAEGKLYINGSLLDESENADDFAQALRLEFTVPEGSVLALPDERAKLTAEAVEKSVTELGEIIGEARLIAYPLSRIRFFH